MIRAVLFDLDGTLVQTEALKAISYAKAAKALKPGLDEAAVIQQYDDLIGRSRNEVAQALVERFDLGESAEEFVAQRMRIYDEMLRDGDLVRRQEYPAATALLRKVKGEGYPTGLATMSYPPETAIVLDALGIRRYLDVIVTRDQVARPKPDPEIYCLTASRLAVAPADCLIVEDSEPGVASALATGAVCVVIPSELTRNRVLARPPGPREHIVTDPADLDRIVGSLLS